MAKRRLVEKALSRRESGTFMPFPTAVLSSVNFRTLSPKANKALMCLCSQLRFSQGGTTNNGDLSFPHSLAEQWGLKSKETVSLALKELLERGWIERTRQGGLCGLRANLYAITFLAIDECGGKLDVPATRTASGKWKHWKAETE